MLRCDGRLVSGGVLMRIAIAAVLMAVLVGCAQNPPPPPAVVYKEKDIPVGVGCVSNKPAPVVRLNEQYTAAQWSALAPGAKAEAVRAQAGSHLNYEDHLNASVAGCQDSPPDESIQPPPQTGGPAGGNKPA